MKKEPDGKEEQIRILGAVPEDAGDLLSIYAPYVTDTAVSFETEVPSEEEFRGRIEHTLQRYPYLKAVSQDGRILGYAYAGVFKDRAAYDHCVETSIYVREGCHGQGIGRALYEALEEKLKASGIRNLYACIAYPTDEEDEYLTKDSALFHERMGYRLAGRFVQCGFKFGRWYDMIWMEKFL